MSSSLAPPLIPCPTPTSTPTRLERMVAHLRTYNRELFLTYDVEATMKWALSAPQAFLIIAEKDVLSLERKEKEKGVVQSPSYYNYEWRHHSAQR